MLDNSTQTKSFQRTLVTAALPYANGPIHVGHLAGAYLPADIFCRFQRLRGLPLLFVCGSDEHGVPIVLRARAENTSPQQIVDYYHAQMRDSFASFGMSFDVFGRTSSKLHYETSQQFFERLDALDAFVQRTESQLYDPEANMFLADRFVRGTCPQCGYDNAYGDQCEQCGRSLSPKELKHPRSAISNATPELRDTTHWYLPLGKVQPQLEVWLGKHADWKPNVMGQVHSWLREGLSDRAVTRDQSWGVPVPESAGKKVHVDTSGKVLYVWFDAPIGYISFTRQWAQEQGKPESWTDWWQDPSSRLVHFIGKDNIVFHCLVFPAMLRCHGKYVLPDNVPANEFLNLEGDKLSTSRNWALWLHELLDDFPADYLRYSLARTLPETKDADFSLTEFQAHINNELADTLGNLVNRSLSFACKYFDGVVPALTNPSEADIAMLDAIKVYPNLVAERLDGFRFRDALSETMTLARIGNKYFNDAAPWATRKSDPQACGNCIHVAVQLCASLSILMEPFIPFSAAKIRSMLGLTNVRSSGPSPTSASSEPDNKLGWNDASRCLVSAGTKLGEVEILFHKIEDEAIAKQKAKLGSGNDQPSQATQTQQLQMQQAPQTPSDDALPLKPFEPLGDTIAYDDFAKLDLRVGQIKACESIAKSRKLLRCEVDLGFETRQILAGIAEHYRPQELVGQKVIVVANLAPRKMMGLESHGMLLMATDRAGKLHVVSADGEPGSYVK